ncbi:alpha/beta fold hydrolase [Nonomuraea zeae]|uniref:Alpha/beta fold hydrolase n=1 Tax=Nonomuraea zeae TaxID=1642303 RepID=A0A5S4H034_9ACTN|nr:alpha/beta fold hydrolase [Nonomuraea zeae]TMR38044.1 alpha/beta fold hydrolase [Nonomuraea zeae]
MVPVDDTAPAVTDTGGPGRPAVYLNGQFADQTYWRRVIAEAASFEAHVGDVDAALAARGVDRPLLVGWSYGAPVALHWAGRNPGRVLGMVSVDGAYPWGWTDTVTPERIRGLFRRWGWLFPVLRPLHLCANMSVEQHAQSNIELVEICATLDPVLARNPNIKVSAKVASNHSKIVRKDFRAVADAVRELAGTARARGRLSRWRTASRSARRRHSPASR